MFYSLYMSVSFSPKGTLLFDSFFAISLPVILRPAVIQEQRVVLAMAFRFPGKFLEMQVNGPGLSLLGNITRRKLAFWQFDSEPKIF